MLAQCSETCVDLHGGLVPTGSFEWCEGKTASGGVVKCHTNTPEVNTHSIGLLMSLAQHSTFIHVWVLQTDTHSLYIYITIAVKIII